LLLPILLATFHTHTHSLVHIAYTPRGAWANKGISWPGILLSARPAVWLSRCPSVPLMHWLNGYAESVYPTAWRNNCQRATALYPQHGRWPSSQWPVDVVSANYKLPAGASANQPPVHGW